MLSPDFSELYSPTIGARHHSLTLALSNFSGGRNIHLTIIDTSGNDKYRRVLSSDSELIESISGILIVFDVTSRNSLESVAGLLYAKISFFIYKSFREMDARDKAHAADAAATGVHPLGWK